MYSTLFSALLTLCGMACLAALLARGNPHHSGLLPKLAAGCVLCSFLLLPIGPFPSYGAASLPVPPMLGWFILFTLGCAGVTLSTPRDFTYYLPQDILSTPLFMGLTYGICAGSAFGFPGHFGYMETFSTLPLGTGSPAGWTGLMQLAGIAFLGLAMLFCGARFTTLLWLRPDIPYLGACLRLAVAAFTVCLFISGHTHLPVSNPTAFFTEYSLYWVLLGVVLGVQTALAPYPRVTCYARLLLSIGILLSL